MTEPTAAAISARSNGRIRGSRSRARRTASSHSTPGADEVGVTKPAVDVLDGRVEDASGCRPRDVEVGLHGRRRAADLVAGHLSVARLLEQLVEDGSGSRSPRPRCGAGLVGEAAEQEPLEPVAGEQLGTGQDPVPSALGLSTRPRVLGPRRRPRRRRRRRRRADLVPRARRSSGRCTCRC